MKLHLIEEKFDSATSQALEAACASLCLKSYRKSEAQYNRISEYKKINISDCEIHVKSLMYPTAPVRRCILDETSQTYICGKCEISCAYEMQCIHSIIANNFEFISSHFYQRHFQREKVSCSYSNFSSNNSENDEEVSEDKNSDNLSFSEVDNTANNNLTNEQRTTSNFESTKNITHNDQTKPLSIKELQQIFNEILSSYRTCSETTKFVLGSMALSSRDMSAKDGKSKGLFDDEKNIDKFLIFGIKYQIWIIHHFFERQQNVHNIFLGGFWK